MSAICQLRANDYDRRASAVAPFGRLRKRGEFDKRGVEMLVPLPELARDAIEAVLKVNPVVGDMPLFAAPRAHVGDRPAAWSRHHARKLLGRAEKAPALSRSRAVTSIRTVGSGRPSESTSRGLTSPRPADGVTCARSSSVTSRRTKRRYSRSSPNRGSCATRNSSG